MKKLLTVTALTLSISFIAVSGKRTVETNASGSTYAYLTSIEQNLLGRLERKIGDSNGAGKHFIEDWISDETEKTGINFFNSFNDPGSPVVEEYSDEYVEHAKKVIYFDVLLGSYLLTDFYTYTEQYRCFLDHLMGQIETFSNYFEKLDGYKAGEVTNEEFFLAGNECYLAAINWLEECTSYTTENPQKPDPFDPNHWILVGPSVEFLIEDFKAYLITEFTENKKDHHLVEILKIDYPFIEAAREYYNDNNLINGTTPVEILEYTDSMRASWSENPSDYTSSVVDIEFLKSHTLNGIFYAIDMIEGALKEYHIPDEFNFVNYLNNFGPTAYWFVDTLESYLFIDDEPACADNAYFLIESLLNFKENVFIHDIRGLYETKFNKLKTQVDEILATETHSAAACKQVCDQVDSVLDAFAIYMEYLMPLLSLDNDLHTKLFNPLYIEITNYSTQVSARETELQSVYVDEIEADLDILEKEIAIAQQMLAIVESDFTEIDEFVEQVKTYAAYIKETINETKACFTSTKISTLSSTFDTFMTVLDEFESDLEDKKELYEKTRLLLNPIETALEDLGFGIASVSGMLLTVEDDFADIEAQIIDLKDGVSGIIALINTAKTELGVTDEIKALENKLSAYNLILDGLELSLDEAEALSLKQQKERTTLQSITDIYEDCKNAFDLIKIGYKSEDVLINDVQETIEDAIDNLKTIPSIVSEFKEETGYDLPGSNTVLSVSVSLIDDYKELLNDALVYASEKEYLSLKAKVDAIEAIYKFNDEKAETYISDCYSIIEEINIIKEAIIARKDIVEDQEGLDAVNTLLTNLRIEVESMSDDIASRHHELVVTNILNDGSVFEERVQEIANNYKHNGFNFKGDLNECNALIDEINKVIAKIDGSDESIKQDNRIVTLRNKLASHVETINGAKESIQKTHALNLTFIIGGSVLAAFGILTLLYFFGFKKRFLRKNA